MSEIFKILRILSSGTLALAVIAFGVFGQVQPAFARGIVLPVAKVTPGAINPNVSQSNIQSTICVTGYTKTIRPPSSYTTRLKKSQLAGAYAFYHDRVTGHFEEDHLISLELGGSPSDPRNLWPEPYAGSAGARVKDKVENKLHALVCSGQVPLTVAQHAIASNWYAAYKKYMPIKVKK